VTDDKRRVREIELQIKRVVGAGGHRQRGIETDLQRHTRAILSTRTPMVAQSSDEASLTNTGTKPVLAPVTPLARAVAAGRRPLDPGYSRARSSFVT
jgi:hypothetical protein